jgi:lysophospholipase L1-like esterase
MYRDVARSRGLRLIDHQPNWKTLQEEDPATFESYVADGVHPNATGLAQIMRPLLRWKLSGRSALP